MDQCSIQGCMQPRHGKLWCEKHYRRWLNHGDPHFTKQPYRGNPEARLESKIDRSGGPDACHPWKGTLDRDGYGQFRIGGLTRGAHVVAWEYASGSTVPDGMHLDHECHNQAVLNGSCTTGKCEHRSCCNEKHIQPKTPKQHKADSDQNYHPCGEDRYWSVKLTDVQVAEIRALLASKVTGRTVAARYGVSEATVSMIKNRKSRV